MFLKPCVVVVVVVVVVVSLGKSCSRLATITMAPRQCIVEYWEQN
jgi:hypothetical protein